MRQPCRIVLWILLTMQVCGATSDAKRVALIIGNATYPDDAPFNPHFGHLTNTLNDARAMQAALQQYGFDDITLKLDADFETLDQAISKFIDKLRKKETDVGLFYFSGHGTQVDGKSYLLPIPDETHPLRDEDEIEKFALNVDFTLSKMTRNSEQRVNLMILDACRTDFKTGKGDPNTGLAAAGASGALVAFASAPGTKALEQKDGDSSYYTDFFVQGLTQFPHEGIEQILKYAAAQVAKATKGRQKPWYNNGLIGDFCFGICQDKLPTPTPQPTATPISAESILAQEAQNAINAGDMEAAKDYVRSLRRKNARSSYLAMLEKQMPTPSTPLRVTPTRTPPLRVTPTRTPPLPELVEGNDCWANETPGATCTEPTTGMEFVYIPVGSFDMGSPDSEEGRDSDEGPVHRVTLKGFWMGKYEVTQAQWQKIMGNNPSNFKGADRPVEQVSWDDTQAFLKKLNSRSGQTFRLPSEAEWEYACRAGTQTAYSFGDDADKLGDYAWYAANSDSQTHPVGKKKSNDFGLFDMHGNVWEWVADTYFDSYQGAPSDGSMRGSLGDKKAKLLRGGSWYNSPTYVRCAFRNGQTPAYRSFNLGMRVVCVR